MKRPLLTLSLFVLTFAQTAFATDLAGDLPGHGLRYPGIYMVEEDMPIVPRAVIVDGKSVENVQFDAYMIYGHQSFAVSFDQLGDVILSVIIPAPDASVGPSMDSFVFGPHDLDNANFAFIENGDKVTLAREYALSGDTEFDVGHCKALVEAHFGFHAGSLCAKSLTTPVLAKVGFYPVSCANPNAQMQVWGERGGCGHVAWRSGNTWSSGDYVGDPGRRFFSQGCYSR
jgi:hypothetical protein